MKYDLIVVGGGPGGLMAAKTAAEDGLQVLLIEQKKDITEGKLWGEMWYIRKISALAGGKTYMEPTAIEIGSETNRLIWPTLGFSFDYDGPLRPFQNWTHVSPAGYQIHKYKPNSEIWTFSIPNSELLRVLLSLVEKAGAEVWTETIGLGAENTSGGVKVRVKTKSGEQTLEASAAIAADGLDSKIVDSLGLNQGRPTAGPPRLTSGNYVVEGLEPDLPECCMAMAIIPSLNPAWNIGIGYPTLGKTSISTLTTGTPSPFTVLDSFMQHPTFAPWFRHARVVKKAGGYSGILRLPIREPVVGNVVLVGDTAAPVETWRHGAIAGGYQAVKAIEKELNGQKGYPEYIDWWQHAFAFNQTEPDYFKVINDYYNLNKLCTDEEVDYIFSLFLRQLATPSVMPAQDLELIKAKCPELDYIQNLLVGKLGIPKMVVAKSLELIEKERPELYEKLIKGKQ